MQKDLAAGRAPELDAIAGPILRGAAAYAIDAPITGELAAIVREMDQAGRARPAGLVDEEIVIRS
jgi:ketopantoate reductase